jgi:hypothetical protein
MESKTFEGKDRFDLDKKLWDWKLSKPDARIIETHSMKGLPARFNKSDSKFARIGPPPDLVSITIDYEESF